MYQQALNLSCIIQLRWKKADLPKGNSQCCLSVFLLWAIGYWKSCFPLHIPLSSFLKNSFVVHIYFLHILLLSLVRLWMWVLNSFTWFQDKRSTLLGVLFVFQHNMWVNISFIQYMSLFAVWLDRLICQLVHVGCVQGWTDWQLLTGPMVNCDTKLKHQLVDVVQQVAISGILLNSQALFSFNNKNSFQHVEWHIST